MMQEKFLGNGNLAIIREKGLAQQNVVIELTENEPVHEYDLEMLLDVAAHYAQRSHSQRCRVRLIGA